MAFFCLPELRRRAGWLPLLPERSSESLLYPFYIGQHQDLLAFALEETTFSWISGKDSVVKWSLLSNLDGSIFASTSQNCSTRDTLFEDMLQLFGKLELLSGMTLHTKEETRASVRDDDLPLFQEICWVLRKRELCDPKLAEAA